MNFLFEINANILFFASKKKQLANKIKWTELNCNCVHFELWFCVIFMRYIWVQSTTKKWFKWNWEIFHVEIQAPEFINE